MKRIKKFAMFLFLMVVIPASFMLTGCFSLKYDVKIDSTLTNITLGVSTKKAKEGDEVVLSYNNLNPDYVFNYYLVDGKKIEGNTFTMPKKNVTVSASLSKIKFYITYVLGEGETTSSPTSYTESQEKIYLADATKTGAIFVGWYLTSNFSGEKVTFIETSSKQDYTLYPKFVSAEVSNDGYRLITSPVDFMDIISANPAGKYRLKNDIDFAGFSYTIMFTEDYFTGEIDGNNKVIKNVTFKNHETCASLGLFYKVKNAKIYNLSLDNFTMHDNVVNSKIGCLVANCFTSEIRNITVTGLNLNLMQSRARCVGCVIADDSGSTLTNIVSKDNNIQLSSANSLMFGSLVGCIDETTLEKSYAEVNNHLSLTITDGMDIEFGGLIGRDEGDSLINNCYFVQSTNSKIGLSNLVNVTTSTAVHAGGIIGHIRYNSIVSNCYASLYKFELLMLNTTQNATRTFGGIVGSDTMCNKIENCFVTANKSNGNLNFSINQVDYLGYILPRNTEKIVNCYYDQDSLFIVGLDVYTSLLDLEKVTVEKFETFKGKLNWSSDIWDLSSNLVLPKLK